MIERIERNIHRVQITRSQKFLLLSDLHWDNPKCDRELLTRHLKQAQERGAKVIINGDFFCFMQGKYDPRRNKMDILPEHNKANYIDAVIEDAVNWFAPYAKDILLVGYGNHETAIVKNLETDPLQRFVDLLNMSCNTSVQVGGYGGVVDFKLNYIESGGRSNVVLKYYHGFGGGGAVTKGVIQDQRMAAMMEGYDIIWMGHVHEIYHHVNVVECYDSHQKKLKLKEVHQVRTGAYKEEYGDGFGGYHIEKGRPPKPMGGYWMTLEVNVSEKDGHRTLKKYIEFTKTD
jgi:UDP-2,3-diacylglucosamine pyrophosphatase LpxH